MYTRYHIPHIFNLPVILYDEGLDVSFRWVPAHVMSGGSVDVLARESIKHETVEQKSKPSLRDIHIKHGKNTGT